MKLLTIDIGNTNITMGLFEGDELKRTWRLATDNQRTSDEYGLLIISLLTQFGEKKIDGACISSVVPPIQPVFEDTLKKFFAIEPVVLGPGVKTGIAVMYENPKEVGADRIANAVGGFYRYKRSLIIVDFGTATTFDYITAKGEYMGGAIAPGIGISSEALFHKTAKLPKVEFQAPSRIVGRNTVESIQSGLFYGYVSMVDGMIKLMKAETKDNPLVIGTGGYAPLIAPKSKTIKIVDPDITLYGLKYIYEKNRK
jgi:type III pantothenate kinase